MSIYGKKIYHRQKNRILFTEKCKIYFPYRYNNQDVMFVNDDTYLYAIPSIL